MTIFKYLNDNNEYMIINLSYDEVSKKENYKDYTILKNKNDEIVGINIFNLEGLNLKLNGLIYPTDEIINWIKNKTKINNLEVKNLIVAAKVIACEDIPNTHLHKCVVTDGINNYDIVCGAKNVENNKIVVLSKIGAILPNGMQIIPRKVGGFQSDGMLCSEKELGLANESNGILLLSPDTEIGKPFKNIYKNMIK
ncbi:MAG: hypothetical protein K2H80_01670 [Ureaplasma sp.]|nr:hypothetical protein [Ureaplasma sp.]